ncbi:MAG: carotenoid oxygenase family protein [Betaproteobacteria bacterium]|nr:carotenoid oxygenase family protein [Betaproteobacteria bacterium]
MNQSNHQDSPFWMTGNHAPVREEVMAFDLEVEGEIPRGLDGLYARNGPNPRRGASGHWFLGDGMVHAVSIQDGQAQWYRNRWVRTPRFAGESRTADTLWDLNYALANTNVIAHGGKILALVENALPYQLNAELDTLGPYDFGGKLTSPFTAHPKVCPITGEMHFFGYRALPPYLTYHVAHASGRIIRSVEVPVKGPTMIHEMALTQGHVIFLDLPVVFDMKLARAGTMPYCWSDSYGARLGILPRGMPIQATRWVEVDPCYVYHVANAFETAAGEIVIDAAWYAEHWRGGPSASTFDSARMKRWRIAPGATRAHEAFIDDRTVEFPRVDDRLTGMQHRHIYAVATDNEFAAGRYHEVIHYDLETGQSVAHDFGTGLPSEFCVAPVSDAPDADCVAMGFVFDPTRNSSDLVILDAQHLKAPALARIRLPRRVPQGFHGNWIKRSALVPTSGR